MYYRYIYFTAVFQIFIVVFFNYFTAEKRKNIALLSVDNNSTFSIPDVYSKPGSSSGSVAKALYIGGNPRNSSDKKYLGCIRNIEIIVNQQQSEKHIFKKFPTQVVHGNVTLSVCPTI